MEIFDILKISGIVSTVVVVCTTIIGWWIKSRIENSIKHEHDKVLEGFKSELKRSDLLISERLVAFKSISPLLLSLKRYCHAARAQNSAASEFESTFEHLNEAENVSLLTHHQLISRKLDEIELFISPKTRSTFDELFAQISIGCNIEIWLISDEPDPEIVTNAHEFYDLVACRVNDVLSSLYSDLSLPKNSTIQSISST